MGRTAWALGGAIVFAIIGSAAVAQSFSVGEQVEASPLMIGSRWEVCTVTAILAGGDVAVTCGPRRTEYVVQDKWVRAVSVSTSKGAHQSTSEPSDRSNATASTGLCPDAPRGRVGNRQQENGICRVGAGVVDREGRRGTVIDAPDSASCRVCLSDGTHRDYLTWMLSTGTSQAAGKARATPAGSYHCSGGAAGNMNITINGGRWNGYYAETLPDGRVGISSRPNGRPYYMVCERR